MRRVPERPGCAEHLELDREDAIGLLRRLGIGLTGQRRITRRTSDEHGSRSFCRSCSWPLLPCCTEALAVREIDLRHLQNDTYEVDLVSRVELRWRHCSWDHAGGMLSSCGLRCSDGDRRGERGGLHAPAPRPSPTAVATAASLPGYRRFVHQATIDLPLRQLGGLFQRCCLDPVNSNPPRST